MSKFVAGEICEVDTSEKDMERESIKYAADEWRITFDSITDLVSIHDRNFKIVRANKACASFFKMTPQELIGKTCYHIFHGTKEPSPYCPYKEMLETGKPSTKEFFEPHLGINLEVSVSPVFNKKREIICATHIVKDITQRKQMEEALKKSEERYRTLLETIGDGILVIDGRGKILYANKILAKMFGFEKLEEGIGRNAFEFVLPKYREKMAKDLKLVLRGRGQFLAEYKVRRKDGSEFWVEAVGNRIDYQGTPCDLVTLRDISRRKKMEEEILENERKFRLVTDESLVGVYIFRDGHKFLYVNPALARILGYTPEEMVGKIGPLDIAHPHDRRLVKEQIRRRMEGEVEIAHYTFRVIRKDGKVIECEVLGRRVDYQGHPAIIGTFLDITARKHAEHESKESLEKLKRILEETVMALSSTIERRDPYTAGHQRKVSILASSIAREMGISGEEIEGLRLGSSIHDVGKISVPAEILNKPTRLTPIEFALIKTHPQVGYGIVKGIEFPWPIREIVLQHHERMDGSGYPQGLKANEIRFEARIVAVADVVEAMSSHRPYRAALGVEKALEEIAEKKGKLYDPEVVEACIKVFKKGFKFGE